MGNKFDKIVGGIYLGNIDGARDKAGMKQSGITHVVSLRDNPEKLHPGEFCYLLVDAEDTPGYQLSQHFNQCTEFIHEALLGNGSVLIHCMAGISRSTTITCVYLMTATGVGMDEVMAAIKVRREVAGPNGGFMHQLRTYEKEDLKEARETLRKKFPDSAALSLRLEAEIKAILAK